MRCYGPYCVPVTSRTIIRDDGERGPDVRQSYRITTSVYDRVNLSWRNSVVANFKYFPPNERIYLIFYVLISNLWVCVDRKTFVVYVTPRVKTRQYVLHPFLRSNPNLRILTLVELVETVFPQSRRFTLDWLNVEQIYVYLKSPRTVIDLL